jgi:accessory gene regulator protein AgrB
LLLKRAALHIGSWIWNQLENETKENIKKQNNDLTEIQNRLKIILLYIAVTLTLLIFGWITGLWLELFLSFISFAFIRWWNGGHHFSVDICYFLTIGVILGVIPLSYIVQDYPTISFITAIVLHSIFAPFNDESKHFYTKKIISLLLCVMSFYVNEILLSMWLVLGFDLIRVKRR